MLCPCQFHTDQRNAAMSQRESVKHLARIAELEKDIGEWAIAADFWQGRAEKAETRIAELEGADRQGEHP